jgi:hypothetical protein
MLVSKDLEYANYATQFLLLKKYSKLYKYEDLVFYRMTGFQPEKLSDSGLARISSCLTYLNSYTNKINSVVLVHKQTMPTERPLLVDDVGANVCR